jgi:hypothetical protein
MQPGAEVTEQLERVFDHVLRASVTDGWRLVERKQTDSPVRSLSAKLEREAASRTFLLMALSRSVMMVQGPQRPEAAAQTQDRQAAASR